MRKKILSFVLEEFRNSYLILQGCTDEELSYVFISKDKKENSVKVFVDELSYDVMVVVNKTQLFRFDTAYSAIKKLWELIKIKEKNDEKN